MNNETSIFPIAQEQTFDSLVESFVTARNKLGNSCLEMAYICLEAKEQLQKEGEWLKWIQDSRINLKETQAKKLIAIAKAYKKEGQSTDLLGKGGIEKAYLLTKIEDEAKREDLAGRIINADFTVKDTKMAVKELNANNIISTEQVIEKIINLPPSSPVPRTDSEEGLIKAMRELKEINKTLKNECNKLIKENEDLRSENSTLKQQLSEKEAEIQANNSIHNFNHKVPANILKSKVPEIIKNTNNEIQKAIEKQSMTGKSNKVPPKKDLNINESAKTLSAHSEPVR